MRPLVSRSLVNPGRCLGLGRPRRAGGSTGRDTLRVSVALVIPLPRFWGHCDNEHYLARSGDQSSARCLTDHQQ